ncbi:MULTISPECIES: LysR family transcriptional regulator [Ferrimonas]|uniref:LysR family transcriptional regulator n=1 Tax=Ferrimonas TaxID=44011 RepID=UPI000A048F1E|nr:MULTISPECIES: LysR family transcriptional regulator [Ferrimonas]USD38121.1 LysR family transcriptional regulator [Ferrimonas sp. SCSIO 43195]
MDKLRDINIFSFQVFVLVYESLNSLSVAQTLNVPASKISRCLNSLRHALDDPLFHRKQYGFEPSEMATRIYPEMKRVLELAGQACSLGQEENNRLKQEIVIACPTGLCIKLAQYLQASANENNQHFTFNVKPITHHIDSEIQHGDIDVAISFESSTAEGVRSQFITEGNALFVVGNHQHPIWQRSIQPQLKEIIDYPFIVTDCPAFNDRIDPLEVYANDIGRHLNIETKVSGLTELADQLETSRGLTFIGQKYAAEFMDRLSDISIRRLPQDQFDLLHQRMGVPNYYLLSHPRQQQMPEWLLSCIEQFIINSVVLPPIESKDYP